MPWNLKYVLSLSLETAMRSQIMSIKRADEDYEDLERRYGPALAQYIFDQIRKTKDSYSEI